MPYEGITDVARQTGDKISGGFVPSLALSIATGGALNPVIIRAIWQPLKEVGGFIKDTLMLPIKILQGLWGSIKNITNVLQKLLEKILYIPSLIIKGLWTGAKTVLSLPFKVLGGIGGMLGFGRGNNEKDASAVNNANDNKLYGRLDKIIGLLEKRSTNVKEDEKKESSGLLSSILGFLPGIIKIGALLALGYGAFKIIGMDKIKEGWDAIKNAKRLGYVQDVCADLETGTITSIIVPGEKKIKAMFSNANDIVIPWKDVKCIGEDLILVDI